VEKRLGGSDREEVLEVVRGGTWLGGAVARSSRRCSVRSSKKNDHRRKQSDHASLHILTDSEVSLHLLRKHLAQPWRTRDSPHRPLLQAIVEAAATRPGGVTVQKVRAHIGVRGNEAADALAKAGASSPVSFDVPESLDPTPTFFTALSAPDSASPTRSSSPADDDDDCAEDRPSPASREELLAEHVRVTILDRPTTYLGAKLSAKPTSPALSFSQHGARVLRERPSGRLPWRDARLGRCVRYGVAPGQTLRHRMGMSPSPACLLCGHARDTGYHSLLSCRPRPHSPATGAALASVVAGMCTLRHNGLVHLVADAVRKSSKDGGSTLLISAGKAPPPAVEQHYLSSALSAQDHIVVRCRSSGEDCTVPSYLLPNYPGRPDLMQIRGWCPLNPGDFPSPASCAGSVTLVPMEFCVCQDDSVLFMHRALERKWFKYSGQPPPHGLPAEQTDFPPPQPPRSQSSTGAARRGLDRLGPTR